MFCDFRFLGTFPEPLGALLNIVPGLAFHQECKAIEGLGLRKFVLGHLPEHVQPLLCFAHRLRSNKLIRDHLVEPHIVPS